MMIEDTPADAASVESDECLLQHVARYSLTVTTVLRSIPGFQSLPRRDLERGLRRLQHRLLLASAPLHFGQTYWHLTAEGARLCGLKDNRGGPLAEAAKIRAYAILHHCCLSDRPRYRLTRAELQRHFPQLCEPGLPSRYVFDPNGHGRLGLVRVDCTFRGRWDRVIESIREDVSRHWTLTGFRDLVRAQRFEIIVLTVLPQKAERIRDALQTHRDAGRIPIHVTSVPALLPLITSIPGKEVSMPSS